MEKIIISIVAAVLIGLGTWNLNQTFNLSIEYILTLPTMTRTVAVDYLQGAQLNARVPIQTIATLALGEQLPVDISAILSTINRSVPIETLTPSSTFIRLAPIEIIKSLNIGAVSYTHLTLADE